MLVKASTYGLVLTVGTTLIASTPAAKWDPLMPFYVFVAVGGFFASFALFKSLKSI